MMLVMWIGNVSVMVQMFVIFYMAFGVVIEEICPSPLLFYVWYPLVRIWIMMKTLTFWWSLRHVFVNQN